LNPFSFKNQAKVHFEIHSINGKAEVNVCVTCGFYCGFRLFIRERVGLCRAVESQPAYLEPNSNSMQKPIGGRSVLRIFAAKSMQKKRLLRKTKPNGSPVYS
jgi:hypothetical protein